MSGKIDHGPNEWTGEPIYMFPSACRRRQSWRVFHRDIEGRIVAEFYGQNARKMAECFIAMCKSSRGAEVGEDER